LLKAAFAIALTFSFGMGNASAQKTDPPDLHMLGTAGIYNNGTEVVGLPNTNQVQLQQTNNSAAALNTPWYLILGIPDPGKVGGGGVPSFSNSSITAVTTTAIGGVTPSWSLDTSSQFTGKSMDSSSGSNDAYSILGLGGQGVDNSNTWTNWSGADQAVNGFIPSNGNHGPPGANLLQFDFVVFDITATLAAKDTATIKFAANLPLGTFVIPYGEDSKHVYVTSFTNAGLITNDSVPVTPNVGVVPAPPSLVLLGFGGLGFALILVRSRRRMAAAA
jgi:hypothetical protein